MGERSIIEIAEALDSGIDVKDITFIDGTVCRVKSLDSVYDAVMLPAFEDLKADKLNYARSFYTQYCNTDPFTGKRLVEPYGEHMYIVQNPPSKPLSQQEMDETYSYPYMRTYHPSYEKDGGVPAISEVKFSLISNRGCFGGLVFSVRLRSIRDASYRREVMNPCWKKQNISHRIRILKVISMMWADQRLISDIHPVRNS